MERADINRRRLVFCKGVTQLNMGGPGPVTGKGLSSGSESHRFGPMDELGGPTAATQKLCRRLRNEVKEQSKVQ